MKKGIKILAYFFGTIIILFGALFLSEAAFEFGSPDKVQFITWYPIVGIVIIIMGILIFYGAHRGEKRTPSLCQWNLEPQLEQKMEPTIFS